MYQSKVQNAMMDGFFEAILKLESVEECYRFFDDICTISELQAISQRMEVARLLNAKETYTAIAARTGASTATISRVNRCLAYGADGYRLVLDRTNAEPESSNEE